MRIGIVPVVLMALCAVGCGRAVGSKADAAKAGQELGKAGSDANTGAQSSPLIQVPFDASGTITVKGKSGSADVTVDASGSGGDADITETIVFHQFSADGKNTFDGNLTQTVSVQTGSTGVATAIHEKGTVTETGDYDSSLDVDYTETVAAAVSGQAVGASVTIDGRITADGKDYEFNHESVTAIASGS